MDKAFYQRLVFTVATNENGEDMVTWADIPHKTTPDAGKDRLVLDVCATEQ